MKNLFLILLFTTLTSCQTLMGALGGGLGGGIGAALGGPPAAAVGAVGGVIAMEAMVGGGSPVEVAAGAAGVVQPQGQIASTVHETGGLIQTVGWWWLILFVFLPLLRKNGRAWFKSSALYMIRYPRKISLHSQKTQFLKKTPTSKLNVYIDWRDYFPLYKPKINNEVFKRRIPIHPRV